MRRRILSIIAAGCLMLSLTMVNTFAASTTLTGNQKLVVEGDDWGPGVIKTILTFNAEVDATSLDVDAFEVREEKEIFNWMTGNLDRGIASREVTDVYLSDTQGNKIINTSGTTVTLEMYVSPDVGSPFIYNGNTGFNDWCAFYELHVSLTSSATITSNGMAIDGIDITPEINLTNTSQRICLGADDFNFGTYTSTSNQTFSYGEYVPTNTNEKRPLVIWLHGAGEGGSDNYIDLLGNKVTALSGSEFQTTMNGAYILTPQSPTMWMDDGTGNYQSGDIGSYYTESLMELIEDYVANNPNIDTNRIIIGGCSNGGYMTMEMILTYPEYFAAAYPICEAFSDEFITDEQINALVENEVGVWFTYAKADTTVNGNLCTVPTYNRLINAGAKNVHISTFETVVDTTGRFVSLVDSAAHEYNGHWSWIYFFNNKCVSDNGGGSAWTWLAKQAKVVTPQPEKEIPAPIPTPTATKQPGNVKTSDVTDVLSVGMLLGISLIGLVWSYQNKKRSNNTN